MKLRLPQQAQSAVGRPVGPGEVRQGEGRSSREHKEQPGVQICRGQAGALRKASWDRGQVGEGHDVWLSP